MSLEHGDGLGSSDMDMLAGARTGSLSAVMLIAVQLFELCELLVLLTC